MRINQECHFPCSMKDARAPHAPLDVRTCIYKRLWLKRGSASFASSPTFQKTLSTKREQQELEEQSSCQALRELTRMLDRCIIRGASLPTIPSRHGMSKRFAALAPSIETNQTQTELRVEVIPSPDMASQLTLHLKATPPCVFRPARP